MPPAVPARIGPPASLEESVFVEMARTTDWLSRGPACLLKDEELSPAQYNVLRILRGAPDGLLCGDIAERMITRDPDITRLVGRMEKRGLVARNRPDCDRRRVLVRISADGLALLARLDGPVQRMHRRQLGHLARRRLEMLCSLLIACRGKD